MPTINSPAQLPSVDRLLNDPELVSLIETHGATQLTRYIREGLTAARELVTGGAAVNSDDLIADIKTRLAQSLQPSLRPVMNLTGTVLHTNLGRAILPEAAIEAITAAARSSTNLEFDLKRGRRGDRHSHLASLLGELTGAEDALVVNNNAAAVLLALNSLALRKEVPVSRGELVEIGGAFRMPDIMARAGCKLVEIGTTNRTHAGDYEAAINAKTALLMKVHTSNYAIEGFTASVDEADLAAIATRHDLPLISDLGSGSLVDLVRYGLPYEPTVRSMLDAGVNLVTFSGDKLLGGPQAGIIVGRASLIDRLKRNPMTRALRPDKLTLAALDAVLRLYRNPQRLCDQLPTMRWLSRDAGDIEAQAKRLAPAIQSANPGFVVEVAPTLSQVGSGALPVSSLPSHAIKLSLPDQRRSGKALQNLARAFRQLPVPVLGRIADDAFWLDPRCLDDETDFLDNLKRLRSP